MDDINPIVHRITVTNGYRFAILPGYARHCAIVETIEDILARHRIIYTDAELTIQLDQLDIRFEKNEDRMFFVLSSAETQIREYLKTTF